MSAVTGISRICSMSPLAGDLTSMIPGGLRNRSRASMVHHAAVHVETILARAQPDANVVESRINNDQNNLEGDVDDKIEVCEQLEPNSGDENNNPQKSLKKLTLSSRNSSEERDLFSDRIGSQIIKDAMRLECEDHPKQSCSYYCFTCSRPICSECQLVNHPTHQTELLHDVTAKRYELLKELVETLDSKIDQLNETRIKLANMNRGENSIMFASADRRSSLTLLPRRFSGKNRAASASQKFTPTFRQSAYGSAKRLSVEQISVSGELLGRRRLHRSSTVDQCSSDSVPELSNGVSPYYREIKSSIGNHKDSSDAASCQSIEAASNASDECFQDSTDGGSSSEAYAGEINSNPLLKMCHRFETVQLSEVNSQRKSSLSLPSDLQPNGHRSKTSEGNGRRKLSLVKDFRDRWVSLTRRKSVAGEGGKFSQSAPVAVTLENMSTQFSSSKPATIKSDKTTSEKDAPKAIKNSKSCKNPKKASLATFEDFEADEAEDDTEKPIILVVQEVDKDSFNSEDLEQSNNSLSLVEKASNSKNFLEAQAGMHSQEALQLPSKTSRSSSYTSLASCLSFNSSIKPGASPNEEEPMDSDAIAEKLTSLNDLCRMASRTLENPPNEELFLFYQQLINSIQNSLNFEITRISDNLDQMIIEGMSKSVEQKEGGKKGKKAMTSEMPMGRFRSSLRRKTVPVCDEREKRVASKRSALVKPQLLWKVDRQSNDSDEICNPSGVTILQDGSVVVASYENSSQTNNRLLLIDSSGLNVNTLAGGDIQPLGVVQTSSGHLAVTDCKGKRVRILSQTGQSVSDIGKGHFGWPYGIAINSKGQLIITDVFNDTVSIYSMDGRRIRTFGAPGASHPAQLRNPYHVTVDYNDNIVVSDYGNNCVKIFEGSSCKLLYSISDRFRKISAPVGPNCGSLINRRHLPMMSHSPAHSATTSVTNPSRLRSPRGLSVDISGNILVADDCAGVCAFDGCGRFVRNVLCENDSVKSPEAIFMNQEGLLAITECNANTTGAVKMFRIYE